MTPFIDMVITDIKKFKSVKSVKWWESGEPHGPHFEIIDKNDGIWRIGERYPGIKCKMYEIVESIRNPHNKDKNKSLGLALTSYYQKKLRPLLNDSSTQAHKKQLINKILAKIHWKYISETTPEKALFDIETNKESLLAFFKQITKNHDDNYHFNGFEFKNDYEKWIDYSKIVNWQLLDIKQDLELGLFLNLYSNEITQYLKEKYNLAHWICLELSYALDFCPANLSIFPFMPDIITSDINELIYEKWKSAKQYRNRNKIKRCPYGPRSGSNWTGD